MNQFSDTLPSVFADDQKTLLSLGLDLDFMILNPNDKKTQQEAAECLAETFAGVDVNGTTVSEPMTIASKLSQSDMLDFVNIYISNIVHQGLCVVAKDRFTGSVIGAIACEDFNPEDEVPVFIGNLEPLNGIIAVLGELDMRLVRALEVSTGKKVAGGEYAHMFMAGAKLGKYKRNVVVHLVNLIMKTALSRGFKGVFAEATNIRSAKLLTDFCGFHLMHDENDEPILTRYAETEVFKTIPPEVAADCRILYRALHV